MQSRARMTSSALHCIWEVESVPNSYKVVGKNEKGRDQVKQEAGGECLTHPLPAFPLQTQSVSFGIHANFMVGKAAEDRNVQGDSSWQVED